MAATAQPESSEWCRRRAIVMAVGLPLVGLVVLYWNVRNARSGLTDYRKEMTGRVQESSISTTTSPNDSNNQQAVGKPNLLLVVRLRGEMGNWLSSLVFAKGIQWWVQDHRDGLPFTLDDDTLFVGERQAGIKWKRALGDIQQCFPNLRHLNVNGGRWDPEFVAKRSELKTRLGESGFEQLVIDRGDSDCGTSEWFCLWKTLGFARELVANITTTHELNRSLAATTSDNDSINTNNIYSHPFLISNQMASFDVLVDQYYDKIRDFLAFDYRACCNSEFQPMANETVFHLRNFRAEMGDRNYYQKGYEELTPHQVAHELLQHLPQGSHVALTARGTEHVQAYVDALTQQRGFHVRITPEHHTGVQDFCFLLQAQHELVGTLRSTYTRWAALLGRSQTAQLYSIDSTATRQSPASSTINNDTSITNELHYEWKHPALRSKIVYHSFVSNQNT